MGIGIYMSMYVFIISPGLILNADWLIHVMYRTILVSYDSIYNFLIKVKINILYSTILWQQNASKMEDMAGLY